MTTSVVITAFNLEKYVAAAIDSVIQQTRGADEIIVVDDCSTDKTPVIIKSFDSRVTYLKMPQNSGGLSSTFYGLKHAKGEIVMFLDGDDLWMNDKIEKILPEFEKDERMAIVSHDYMRVNAQLRDLMIFDDTQENIATILKGTTGLTDLSNAFRDSILGKKGFWGGSAYSIRKKYVDIEKFENWITSFKYIRSTYLDLVLPTFMLVDNQEILVGYVHEKLFKYRLHGENTSGNNIPTIEAARKALNMGYRTTQATYQMMKDKIGLEKYCHRQYLLIQEYEYLDDLYLNKKVKMLRSYFYLANKLWNQKKKIKESKRLIVTLLFGPSFFLKLKNKMY